MSGPYSKCAEVGSPPGFTIALSVALVVVKVVGGGGVVGSVGGPMDPVRTVLPVPPPPVVPSGPPDSGPFGSVVNASSEPLLVPPGFVAEILKW